MGVQDRDWYRDAQNKRQRTARVHRISPTRKTSSFWIVVFWVVVMGVMFLAMQRALKPKPAVVTAQGELRIPVGRDGHFRAEGTVNGKPVQFLIDTGASSVTVSEQFAASAGLYGGIPTVFHTANGSITGRTVRDVPVSLGPISVSGISVGVGLVGQGAGQGLLGQNFLSKFQITLDKNEMILRRQ